MSSEDYKAEQTEVKDMSEDEEVCEYMRQEVAEVEVHEHEKTPQNTKDAEQCIQSGKKEDSMTRSKRNREDDDDDEWLKVEKKVKKIKVEITISNKEKLPKQFAIAKLLTSLGFKDICRIKYINPYKLKLEVPSNEYAEKITNCDEFKNRGWRVQRASDVNVSYGILRDVDLDLSDEQALNAITCPNDVTISSLKRLNRRNEVGKWVPSEVARVTFNCSYLPAYIFIGNLRTKVEPYVFPVTQCSNCWKFGHTRLRCTSKKIVCPKCTGYHDNCEVKIFQCANCHGDHMALDRSCPAYLREKRLRELMAEFNCSYSCACNMYVRPDSRKEIRPICDPKPSLNNELPLFDSSNSFARLQSDNMNEFNYTQILPEFPQLFTPKRPPSNTKTRNKQSLASEKTYSSAAKSDREGRSASRASPAASECIPDRPTDHNEHNVNKPRGVCFSELMTRIKDIIFVRNMNWHEKIKNVVKIFIEWLVLVVVDNMSDWPILNNVFETIIKLVNG